MPGYKGYGDRAIDGLGLGAGRRSMLGNVSHGIISGNVSDERKGVLLSFSC